MRDWMPVKVEGATGYIDTNYEGKVAAALSALERGNFVFLHVEAPDEASHAGSLEMKIQAIECFDKRIVGPIVAGAKKFGNVHMLVATDHFTPVINANAFNGSCAVLAGGGFEIRAVQDRARAAGIAKERLTQPAFSSSPVRICSEFS